MNTTYEVIDNELIIRDENDIGSHLFKLARLSPTEIRRCSGEGYFAGKTNSLINMITYFPNSPLFREFHLLLRENFVPSGVGQ